MKEIMDKKVQVLVAALGGVAIGVIIMGLVWGFRNRATQLPVLPKPEVTGGERGVLGIDKNINEESIDKYLDREDSVYRDMRMLKDPGNYEAVGGDSYLSGFVKGFEAVPYPYLTRVKGLPEAIGDSYTGKTLFTQNSDGTYRANYRESLQYLEYYFPKDKNIFLMCGGGGYAGMTKRLLVSLGWDEQKIYNVGGYWYYNGENKIQVKKTVGGKDKYDFWKVVYHDIDFGQLTESDDKKMSLESKYYNKGNFIDVNSDDAAELRKENYVLFVHNNYCGMAKSCEEIFATIMKKYKIDFLSIPFNEFKKTSLYETVKYAPSIMIVKKGKIVAYLDAESDEDLPKYQDTQSFERWLGEYIYLVRSSN